MDSLVRAGVPMNAMAFYGRWWQLERWLREIAYVEMRANYGAPWTGRLSGTAPKRAANDTVNAYMASADADDLLAYADVKDLFALIEDHWTLFESYLPPLRRWQGTTDMLGDLRNRNAHCRRPHPDDLGRLEQTLRDLESGARDFYVSYATTHDVPQRSKDPMAREWVAGRHETAVRLLQHAANQYDTRFELRYSVRPWAATPSPNHLSGFEGVLWHANWIVTGPEIRPVELWQRLMQQPKVESLIVHLIIDLGHVSVTFSALDDVQLVADAIGHTFDAILTTSAPFRTVDFKDFEDAMSKWKRGVEKLPSRVQIDTPIALMDPYNPDAFAIFAA